MDVSHIVCHALFVCWFGHLDRLSRSDVVYTACPLEMCAMLHPHLSSSTWNTCVDK